MSTPFKYGIVSEVKPGFAKVYFEGDDGIVTDWWPVIQRTSLKDKESWPLNVNEHVACLCDERLEEGVVLGAVYSDADTPDSGATAGKFRQVFEDGALVEYDKAAHKFKVLASNGESLKDIFTLIIQSVQPILVIYGNDPDFAKLTQALTKVNNMFA